MLQSDVIEAMKKVRESSKQRKFVQSWDLIVNLKEIDMKKDENKINDELALPHEIGKEIKICVIADSLASKASAADMIIKKDELAAYGQDKKKVKKLAGDMSFFFSEISLMPLVGKTLGSVLGPRGKMPKPLAPNADIAALVKRAKKTIRVKTKDSPVVHMLAGNEKMEDEKVAENVLSAMDFIEKKLPKGKQNIKEVLIKLTMGAPQRIKM